MTRELIIDGEHMDLAPDTDVTLEFLSNMLSDPGKISLSHSYTIKLPRTTRNAKILDVPEIPGHVSQHTRRFLPARFIQNGVDLIGPTQAYILQTTPEAYEVALVWNTLEALQVLSENDATINELPDLPVLPWIGSSGICPDFNYANVVNDAFFASYSSGLGPYSPDQVNTAPHPSMRFDALLRRILNNAGVPFVLSANAQEAIGNKVVLAAPGHTPNKAMELSSGFVAQAAALQSGVLAPYEFEQGWDSPWYGGSYKTGDISTHNVLLNMRAPSDADFSGAYAEIYGKTLDSTHQESLLKVKFEQDETGWYLFIDEKIDLSSWDYYIISLTSSVDPDTRVTFSAYDTQYPVLAVNRVHETINVSKDNRFPLEGNLPDIRQWDFIKAVMAVCGLAPIIQNGTLNFYTNAELLDRTDAYDWTHKVDMTDGGPEVLKYTIDGWAQRNSIKFKENPDLSKNQDAELVVEDATIKDSRDFFDLPFAASQGRIATHYSVTKDGDSYEVEDIDIEPRFFVAAEAEPILSRGQAWLYFTDDLFGKSLIDTHYKELQAIVRTPVMLTVNIRLHEVDLAKLDLTRPVYLGQFGQYYGILKIQTGADLCKVELIQLT